MNKLPPLPESVRAEMRADRDKYYFCRVVDKTHSLIVEIPRDATGEVRGLTADFYHKATIYVGGASGFDGLAIVPVLKPRKSK